MATFDVIVLSVIGLSGLLGVFRGFVREVLSVVAYILAFLGMAYWGPSAYPLIHGWIENTLVAQILAYVLTFVIILIIVGLVNALLGRLIQMAGLGSMDRLLGLLFGLVRGFVFVLFMVAIAGYTKLPQEKWWTEAKTSQPLVNIVKSLGVKLPKDLQKYKPFA